MRSATLLLLSPPGLAYGHFLLTYPPSIGFDDGREEEGPCGGFPIVFNSMTAPCINLTFGGFPIELRNTHPQAAWLFRATLGHQAPFSWTNLLRMVSETGIGQFCVPDLDAPVDFAGFPGIVQVVQENDSTLLYQVSDAFSSRPSSAKKLKCAVVNFVSGATHRATQRVRMQRV
jgi:hypothetical protein